MWNRSPEKIAAWTEKGGKGAAKFLPGIVEGAEFVFLCLGDDPDVEDVFGKLEGSLKPGQIIIDHTTGSADLARRLRGAQQGDGRCLSRCARIGRPGGRGEWPAHRDGRRRCFRLREGRTGDARLLKAGHAHRRQRRRAACQVGQPDLHRRHRAGSRRGPSLCARKRSRRSKGDRGDRERCGAELADGEPLEDNGRRQVRFRVCRRLDAQGPPHRACFRARAPALRRRSPPWSTSSMPTCRPRVMAGGIRRALSRA